ncbi:tetratricopeptide repeat-containing protein [Geodermatophilus maliterrae]|uniref:Tetratricopeptide repeat-containing protein n=1 Tax=Geodermatophilus maliterrae TaxID=3162531 RepID=A0ABV3X8W4_9ACTN
MRAFVIRGFGVKAGVDFDRVHEDLIGPAVEAVGLEGGTTGVIVEAGNVRDDVIHELLMADLVVADVSVHNANVFYELGVRHAVRHRATVLIRARIDEMPFDLRGERYLSYDQSAPAEAVPRLVQALRETLANERVDSPVFAYVPGLATGGRAALLEVPRDLAEDIEQAREQKWAGDLRLIAEEVTGLRFEEAALRAVARASADVGDDSGARDAWERIRAAHPDDFQVNQALSDTYRRLGDLVASDQAIERALGGAALGTRDRAELFALRASNSKRRWTKQWRSADDPSARVRLALRSRELEGALRSYIRGFEEDLNHSYSGINALAMGRIALELAVRDRSTWQTRFDTDEEADIVMRRLGSQVASLTSTVRASLDTARARCHRAGTTDPWLDISFADLRFLTNDDPERVSAAYEAAMSPLLSRATVRSIKEQAEIYRDLGILVENAEATLAVLPEAGVQETARIHPLVFSGHMIDAPGREQPRFPPDAEEVAARAIREQVSEIKAAAEADPGVELLGVAGASDGGDLLFHEACHELGVTTHVVLPVPELVYRATALSRQASRWAERYHTALRRAAEVRTLARSHTMPGWLATRPDYDTWQRSNRWVLHYAWATTTTGRVTVLALWNGLMGDGKGGVADMVATGLQRGAEVVTVDTVGLFGLTEALGNQPAGVAVGSGAAPDPTRARVPEGPGAVPAAADRVGPLGGAVGILPTAVEASPLQPDTAGDTGVLDG